MAWTEQQYDTALDEKDAEIERLRDEVKQKDAFIEAAFEAHSNLDLDVERVVESKEGE